MRVLINAASANMGGSVTYLQNLLRWLPTVAPTDHFIFFVPGATVEKLSHLSVAENVEVRPYPYARTGGPERLYFDQVEIPGLLRRLGADVLFSSTGFGTFASPRPQVLLVRNLAYFDPAFQERYRQLGRSLRKNTTRRWISIVSIQRADAVLFPTRAMQDMVSKYVDLSGKRTEAFHYGFDPQAIRSRSTDSAPILQQVARLKENHRVLLNVSTFSVQKNLETLIEALARLRERGLDVVLLTTTSRDKTTDTAEYDALVRRAEELGVRQNWVELGYVPYHELGHLYELADLYVFPSFTESFGHSLVEAMACGLPVVASGMPVNREVCGDAGVYFDTFDAADCANKIAAVLTDASKAEDLVAASRRRAEHFSWRGYVEQLVELFRQQAAAARPERSRSAA